MNKISTLLARLSLPKLVRHALAAFGGALAGHGIEGDVMIFPSLLSGLVVFAISTLWSHFAKVRLDDSQTVIARKLTEALTQQAMAALSGLLAARGFNGDMQSTEAIVLFVANYALSAMARPDAKPKEKPRTEMVLPDGEAPRGKGKEGEWE